MTAKIFPAQQMCCLLVNWSTGRFEYIFLNYYQCHKDWRRRRWTVRANTRQLMLKLMTKIKIDHMGSEGRLYSSKSTNGGKGLQNSKINSYFTP